MIEKRIGKLIAQNCLSLDFIAELKKAAVVRAMLFSIASGRATNSLLKMGSFRSILHLFLDV